MGAQWSSVWWVSHGVSNIIMPLSYARSLKVSM